MISLLYASLLFAAQTPAPADPPPPPPDVVVMARKLHRLRLRY